MPDGRGRNGEVTAYRISYNMNNDMGVMETDLITSGTTYEVKGLVRDSVYEVRVRTVTSAGEGVYSDALSVSTGGD